MALWQTTGGKDEPNIVLCGNHNGHHHTKLGTLKHIIGQHKKIKRWATRTPPKQWLHYQLPICTKHWKAMRRWTSQSVSQSVRKSWKLVTMTTLIYKLFVPYVLMVDQCVIYLTHIHHRYFHSWTSVVYKLMCFPPPMQQIMCSVLARKYMSKVRIICWCSFCDF